MSRQSLTEDSQDEIVSGWELTQLDQIRTLNGYRSIDNNGDDPYFFLQGFSGRDPKFSKNAFYAVRKSGLLRNVINETIQATTEEWGQQSNAFIRNERRERPEPFNDLLADNLEVNIKAILPKPKQQADD